MASRVTLALSSQPTPTTGAILKTPGFAQNLTQGGSPALQGKRAAGREIEH